MSERERMSFPVIAKANPLELKASSFVPPDRGASGPDRRNAAGFPPEDLEALGHDSQESSPWSRKALVNCV
jgi:hypothetical protein